ncbi:hypothetical protein V8F20_009422 [Naviculisporaceae sp. PSN 640]
MFFYSFLRLAPIASLFAATLATPARPLSPRACYAGESAKLLCYTPPNGDPQGVLEEDVAYVASYLRTYGGQTRLGRLFSMSAADAPDCGEWSVYSYGTALAVAKKINNTINASVLFADIATTIDGGVNPTPDSKANSILYGCGDAGGSLGVRVNASAPIYKSTTSYPAGYVPDGIVIKVVWSGQN